MTLGRWFRDYIYIPLGGSRAGKLNYLWALFTVWFTTGLWHGASWNFIFWGLYFGLFILLEKFLLKRLLEHIHPVISNLYTMLVVMVGWVLFDTTSLSHAGSYLRALAGGGAGLYDQAGIYYLYTYLPILLLGTVLVRPGIFNRLQRMKYRMNNSRRVFLLLGLAGLFVVSVAYILNQSFSPSLYIGF